MLSRATLFALLPAMLVGRCDAQPPTTRAGDSVLLPRHAIVFAQHSDAARKDYDLWQVAADGTQLASVVVGPGHQTQFTISPDGNELIYVDGESGRRDLFQRRFGGGPATNLTDSSSNDSGPVWSPDGSQVLFASDRHDSRPELYVLSLSDHRVRRITQNSLHDSGGSWSPDGTRVLLTRYLPAPEGAETPGHGAIFELNLETSEEKQLSDLGGYCGAPRYSPDGGTIAFHRTTASGSEIWLMNADGSDPRALTNTYVDEYSPSWSPDGRWMAFTAGTGSDGRGTFDLWLMKPDGSRRRLVLAAANTQMSPQWRPGEHWLLGPDRPDATVSVPPRPEPDGLPPTSTKSPAADGR